jgi:hypothetical protein
MLDEQYERSDPRPAATDPLRMDSVPSDQLWRAAVLAARRAATAAAELRRALDEDAGAPPPTCDPSAPPSEPMVA